MFSGECKCEENWIGEDCSVNATVPPALTRFQSGDLCDMQVSKHCMKLIIIGSNFVDSSSALCHVTEISVSGFYCVTLVMSR